MGAARRCVRACVRAVGRPYLAVGARKPRQREGAVEAALDDVLCAHPERGALRVKVKLVCTFLQVIPFLGNTYSVFLPNYFTDWVDAFGSILNIGWEDIVAPHQTTDVGYASRSVALLKIDVEHDEARRVALLGT